ncbi:hypothetical protein E5K00_08745 [Hymenobacter aquaticus]|uniref:Uncharacterized protein n=1 Tax=Hymenobacter aquaticus TaxID=1867101 RepID=A0A4Z0Q868_9BACT|nr:hypothetical protein [Hymenobacter aquaticus]TGE25261.1 hypothetical protein E5K00_08745 [Hymenobacter aquaticus]
MKKLLSFAAAGLCSVAVLAQTESPTAQAQVLDKPIAADNRRTDDRGPTHRPPRQHQLTARAAHGQLVRTVAHSPVADGARRGPAVSAVASGDRRPARTLRPARRERSAGRRVGTAASRPGHHPKQ